MISRNAIQSLMKAGLITVSPTPVKMGPNSIDLRLGDELKTYHPTKNRIRVVDPVGGGTFYAIDPKNPPPLVDVPRLPDGKWLLVPGQFYLGVTLEETFCRGVVPHLDGRSTCGRLSIEAHKTAGVGDNGFRGRWTLEIEVTEPVLVAPGDRLFQVYFTPCWGQGLALLLQAAFDSRDSVRVVETVGGVEVCAPLLELDDLYGQGEGHYQGSKGVRGPSPLD